MSLAKNRDRIGHFVSRESVISSDETSEARGFNVDVAVAGVTEAGLATTDAGSSTIHPRSSGKGRAEGDVVATLWNADLFSRCSTWNFSATRGLVHASAMFEQLHPMFGVVDGS